MRRATLFTGALLPFMFLACGGAPDSQIAGQEARQTEPTAPLASDSTPTAPLESDSAPKPRKRDDTAALANLACVVAAGAAGVPEACTVLSGAETILSFIQGLDSGSSSQAQIASQLAQLNQEMAQVDSDIKAFYAAFNAAAYQIEQTQQLMEQGTIHNFETQAQDASVRLSTWVAKGSSDPVEIATIDQESSEAAMALTNTAYWYRASSVAGGAPVFDLRNALLSYLYALAVRLAVIQAEDPNYRCANSSPFIPCTMPYTDELQTHLSFLNSLPGLNAGNFQRNKQLQYADNSYAMCDWVQDINSGFIVFADWQGNPPYGEAPSQCVGPLVLSSTQANDAMQFLGFWDQWWVDEEMGIHAIQKMASTVSVDMTYDWRMPVHGCLPGRSCPTPYTPLGPLVDNNGLCLSLNHGSYETQNGLFMEHCSDGAEYQTWQTATMGQTGTLGLSDQTMCAEVNLWNGYAGTTLSNNHACSASSGEEFTVTTANELRWSRDPSLCLTSNGGPEVVVYQTYDRAVTLQTCDGQPHQKWGRSWPVVHLLPI